MRRFQPLIFVAAVAILMIGVFPLFATTWSKWNGVTVGSSTGNISTIFGVAIGTSTGNVGSWNGLTSPGGGGATCAAPTFSPNGGNFTTTQTVTMSFVCSVGCYSNSTITVLVAGTCPVGSTTYTTGISVSSGQTLYGVATQVGMTSSSNASVVFSIMARTSLGVINVTSVTSPQTKSITVATNALLLMQCQGVTLSASWNSISMNADVTNGNLFVFSLYVTSGATANVSLSGWSSTHNLSCAIIQLTGTPSVGYFDQSASASGMTGVAPSSGATSTTSQANEFVWGAIGTNGSSYTAVWLNSFNAGQRACGTGNTCMNEGYLSVSATGAYTSAASNAVPATSWYDTVATYKGQ